MYNPKERTLFTREYMVLKISLTTKCESKASEGYSYVIRRILSHQKDCEHIRRMICPKCFDYKGEPQKVDLHEEDLTLNACST